MAETRDTRAIWWSLFVGEQNVASVGVEDVIEKPITLRVYNHLSNGAMISTDIEIEKPGLDPTITHEYYDGATEEHRRWSPGEEPQDVEEEDDDSDE